MLAEEIDLLIATQGEEYDTTNPRCSRVLHF